MVFSEQGFDQIEADEAGCAGDYQALLTCDLGLLSLLGVGGSFDRIPGTPYLIPVFF